MAATNSIAWLTLGVALGALTACTPDTVPKPRGYFRIDLPASTYRPYTGDCAFSAEVPGYAAMTRRALDTLQRNDTSCWVEMRFPAQRANIYMTYRRVSNDLAELINDAHAFKSKHEVKAARIANERLVRPEAKVYGNIFDVEGDVASPLVFYFTDSTQHFLYGSLYFDARPNADSLAPVTARIREDLRHFARTLSWR